VGPREFHPEISSTQDRAKELARAGAPEGTRVVALVQTRGRGRLDRAWASPPGGLYLSILLRSPPEHVSLLPLSLGARIAEEFSRTLDEPFRVKWPNDVLAASERGRLRKVAGVLVDRVDTRESLSMEVAGIGVNVSTDASQLPPEVRDHATSLAAVSSRAISVDTVEEMVVRAASHAVDGLRADDGPESTVALCRRWMWGMGHEATLDGAPSGTIAGIDAEGALLLDRGSERVAIRTGEVRVQGAG